MWSWQLTIFENEIIFELIHVTLQPHDYNTNHVAVRGVHISVLAMPTYHGRERFSAEYATSKRVTKQRTEE